MSGHEEPDFLSSLSAETVECFKAVKQKMREEGGPLFHKLGFIFPEQEIAAYCIAKRNKVDSVFRLLKWNLENFLYDKLLETSTFSPSNVEHILKSQRTIQSLKRRTKEGKLVTILKPGTWLVEKYGIEDLLKVYCLIACDMLKNNPPTAIVGGIIVLDCDGFQSKHSRFYFGMLLKHLGTLKDQPSMSTEVHCVNNGKVVQLLISTGVKLLPAKVVGKIKLHKNGTSELGKYIDPDILPKSMGGNLNDEKDVFDDSSYERIMKDEEIYLRFQRAIEEFRESNLH